MKFKYTTDYEVYPKCQNYTSTLTREGRTYNLWSDEWTTAEVDLKALQSLFHMYQAGYTPNYIMPLPGWYPDFEVHPMQEWGSC